MSELFSIYQTLQSKKWVNLSHQINETSPHFPALPALEKKELFNHNDGFLVHQFSVVSQYGTHIDAPIHFVKDARWLEEIDLKDLFLPLYVIDKSEAVQENPDYRLTKEDILEFEKIEGAIREGSFVAFRSDWSKHWPNQDRIRNLDENGVQHTPGWTREALEYLIVEKKVKAVGHETLDTDSGIDTSKHGLINEYYLLEQDIYQLELLANLDQVPPTGSLIQIAYPNWDKASGSPVRAIAILP
ncbi:MAG: cyclase family protein [Streptococcus sp.]|nr:cyclase family protein [Streptococcus sp.]